MSSRRRNLNNRIDDGLNRWLGDYPDWKSAEAHCTGYDSAQILDQVFQATIQVKNGSAKFERDSVLFDEIQYSWPITAFLTRIALEATGKLTVVDFGGALGSHYYQNKDFLAGVARLTWVVVEQPSFVEKGRQFFEDESLKFETTLGKACELYSPDVLLVSCVLPYLPDPKATLDSMMKLNIPWILLDRNLIVPRQRLTIQHVPASIYEASYPCWLLERESIDEILSVKYDLVLDFAASDGNLGDGIESVGSVYRRRTN